MNAADIMTRSVITISPEATLADAVRLMLDQRISGLPVIDSAGRLVGMLTEGDLLRRVEIGTERRRSRWLEFLRGPGQEAEDYVHTHGRKVHELMTSGAASVGENTSLADVVATMESKRVRRVPVESQGRFVGLISRSDLLRVLATKLAENAPAPAGDDAIREQVIAALNEQKYGGQARVSVVVTDGVVYLKGFVYDPRERDAIRVAAENVPGVREVRDQIEYFDGSMGMAVGL